MFKSLFNKGKTLDNFKENLQNRETIDLLLSISTSPPHFPTHKGTNEVICVNVVNFCAHNPRHEHVWKENFLLTVSVPHKPFPCRREAVNHSVEKHAELDPLVALALDLDIRLDGHHLRGPHDAAPPCEETCSWATATSGALNP